MYLIESASMVCLIFLPGTEIKTKCLLSFLDLVCSLKLDNQNLLTFVKLLLC